jgi:hypothetical protein
MVLNIVLHPFLRSSTPAASIRPARAHDISDLADLLCGQLRRIARITTADHEEID